MGFYRVYDEVADIIRESYDGSVNPSVSVYSTLDKKKFSSEDENLVLVTPVSPMQFDNRGPVGRSKSAQFQVDVRYKVGRGISLDEGKFEYEQILEELQRVFYVNRKVCEDSFDNLNDLSLQTLEVENWEDFSGDKRLMFRSVYTLNARILYEIVEGVKR